MLNLKLSGSKSLLRCFLLRRIEDKQGITKNEHIKSPFDLVVTRNRMIILQGRNLLE